MIQIENRNIRLIRKKLGVCIVIRVFLLHVLLDLLFCKMHKKKKKRQVTGVQTN